MFFQKLSTERVLKYFKKIVVKLEKGVNLA